MISTTQKHLDAISARRLTKTNVIGIRKALAHVGRIRRGYSGNRSSATPAQADRMESEIEHKRPTVLGELHDSGVKLLRSPRWRKRFSEEQHKIIGKEGDPIRFDLIRFDREGGALIPVYCVISWNGKFCFRNIPWQTAWAAGLERGPTVEPDNAK